MEFLFKLFDLVVIFRTLKLSNLSKLSLGPKNNPSTKTIKSCKFSVLFPFSNSPFPVSDNVRKLYLLTVQRFPRYILGVHLQKSARDKKQNFWRDRNTIQDPEQTKVSSAKQNMSRVAWVGLFFKLRVSVNRRKTTYQGLTKPCNSKSKC